MYKTYYGFSGNPFSKGVKTQDLFMHGHFKELSGRFDYMKQYRGIMLLTGDPGTGKTTSLRYFISSLQDQLFYPVYLPLSTVGITDFYRQLNDKLGGEPGHIKSRLFKSIQKRILDLATNQNRIPLIIIDECHLLKNDNFFELQIITNFHLDSLDPYIIILAAQSHLNDRLRRSILRSFAQRISMKFHLNPLGMDACKEYILHTLRTNNVPTDILSEPAYKAVFNISRGVLRTAGTLMIKTLSYGASCKKQRLSEEDVFEASKEL
jgi:type II secretory pathway predicted ATPase ExeA